MLLKHWQVWGLDHLYRKPLSVFDCPLSKEMLNVQAKPSWHRFELFPRILSLDTWEKETSTSPFTSPPWDAVESNETASQPPLLWIKQAQSPQPSSPFLSFTALLCMHSRISTTFSNCGAQDCTQWSREAHTEYSGTIPSFSQQSHAVFDAPNVFCPLGWQGSLTADLCQASCSPIPTYPFLQGCSTATLLPIYTCVQPYSS